MVDANVSHDIEDRLRNIESHMGIGHTDPETGEYSVDQHQAVDQPSGQAGEVSDEDEEGV